MKSKIMIFLLALGLAGCNYPPQGGVEAGAAVAGKIPVPKFTALVENGKAICGVARSSLSPIDMQARRFIYDKATGRLTFPGPGTYEMLKQTWCY